VLERPGLETRERCDVEETEALAGPLAVRLHRPPAGLVAGIVVHHDHFEVRIVETRERIERLDQHVRRLVVGRKMHRELAIRGLQGRDGISSRACPPAQCASAHSCASANNTAMTPSIPRISSEPTTTLVGVRYCCV